MDAAVGEFVQTTSVDVAHALGAWPTPFGDEPGGGAVDEELIPVFGFSGGCALSLVLPFLNTTTVSPLCERFISEHHHRISSGSNFFSGFGGSCANRCAR